MRLHSAPRSYGAVALSGSFLKLGAGGLFSEIGRQRGPVQGRRPPLPDTFRSFPMHESRDTLATVDRSLTNILEPLGKGKIRSRTSSWDQKHVILAKRSPWANHCAWCARRGRWSLRGRRRMRPGGLTLSPVTLQHLWCNALRYDVTRRLLRHQASRPPPLAKIRPGSPAPMVGPGTAATLWSRMPIRLVLGSE
jgi:hypothetical protein